MNLPTTVAVTGGRNYDDVEKVHAVLYEVDRHHSVRKLVHGGEDGADSLAGGWARRNDVLEVVYPANWDEYWRNAVPLRNQAMLEDAKPDLLVAFPGGRGTAHCVSVARDLGIPVLEVGS